MDAFSRVYLHCLEQLIGEVQLDDSLVDLSVQQDVSHSVDEAHRGSLLCLLLQAPMFTSSTQGPLFVLQGCSVLDDEEVSRSDSVTLPSLASSLAWDQQFHSSSTVRSAMKSWIGAVGTGCGLPYPMMRFSKSLSKFVSLICCKILPGLLAMIESDVLHKAPIGLMTSSCEKGQADVTLSEKSDTDSSPIRAPTVRDGNCSKVKTGEDDTSDSDELYSFRPLIQSVLMALMKFLSGGMPSSSSPSMSNGLTLQLSQLLLSTEPDLEGMERVTTAISNCLLLRAVCAVLSDALRRKYNIAVSLDDSSMDISTDGDLQTQLADLMKQYESSVRILSEHLVDLALARNELLIANFIDPVDCALEAFEAEKISEKTTTTSVQLFDRHFRALWHMLSTTCPAGLARQIMAHVSSQCFCNTVQLFSTSDYLENANKAKIKWNLWSLLRTAHFCLFVSAETVAEVIGCGQLSTEIALLHSASQQLLQIFVCRFMPENVWNKRDRREQTELQVEWELFALSRHFDPTRLLNLITSSNARLSIALLCNQRLSRAINSDQEMHVSTQAFTTLFRICGLISTLDSFHSTVMLALCSKQTVACQPWTIDLDSSDDTCPNRWPIWFRAIIHLLDSSLNQLWETFKQLVRRHVQTDQSLSSERLRAVDPLQSPRQYLARHQPERRAIWNSLCPTGLFPCGCQLPQPIQLGATENATDNNQPALSMSRSKRERQAEFEKWQAASNACTYTSYYQTGGQLRSAWHTVAIDLMRTVVTQLPTGIQLALLPLEEMIQNDCRLGRMRGASLGTHLILANLLGRIFNEFGGNSGPNSESDQRVERLQYLILWEHLCSLLEADEKEESEIVDYRKRILGYLEDLKGTVSDHAEPVGHSTPGRKFQLAQHLRLVQQKALPDLYFIHTFFKCNITWVRNNLRKSNGNPLGYNEDSEGDLVLDLTKANWSSAEEEPLLADCDKLHWSDLSLVNIGLTAGDVELLRNESSLGDSAPWKTSMKTTVPLWES